MLAIIKYYFSNDHDYYGEDSYEIMAVCTSEESAQLLMKLCVTDAKTNWASGYTAMTVIDERRIDLCDHNLIQSIRIEEIQPDELISINPIAAYGVRPFPKYIYELE